MSTPLPSSAPFALSTRILAGSLMGALVVIGVALSVVLPAPESVPVAVLAVQVLAGVAAHVLLEAVGYRSGPHALAGADDHAVRHR